MAWRTGGLEGGGFRGCGDGENSWRKTTVEVLAKAQRRYHKFMSARFEALPRQERRAKRLALPRCVFFAPVCFARSTPFVCARMRVRVRVRVYKSATVRFPLFHLYSEGCALVGCRNVHACVK